MMDNANRFREKIRSGLVCLGTGITFYDPTVTEAMATAFDFVWIDMEHNALSLESVQNHIMATKGTPATPLVRVPWNDAVLIKPVLDIGAAGIIVPMIRDAGDVRDAVAACLYPPLGIRGIGPRRASNYGRIPEAEFCRMANDTILIIVQIENTDAVRNLHEILAVPGLTSIVVGPGDLAASMGYIGRRSDPQVEHVIERIIVTARGAGVIVGVASGSDPEPLKRYIDVGAQWLALGNDTSLMLQAADDAIAAIGGRSIAARVQSRSA
jgi:4-hydroxy-2-oxoheptanedioate aldolase